MPIGPIPGMVPSFFFRSGGNRISTGTPFATSFGGTAANLNDNNPATLFIWTPGNLSGTALNGRIAGYIDYGSIISLSQIQAVAYTDSAGGNTMFLATSNDAANWTSVYNPTGIGVGTNTWSITGSFSARYIGFAPAQAGYGASTLSVGDLNGYN